MRRNTVKRMIIAGACALMLAIGSSQPSVAAPQCDEQEFCWYELDCFTVDHEGAIVWVCKIVKRCYC